MSLSNEQFEFTKDVIKLLNFIVYELGYKVTLGEVLRPLDMQKIYYQQGKTLTLKSKHMEKKAIDLNVFINGVLTYTYKDLKVIGDFWESFNPLNKWGGNFKSLSDTNHYERR